MFTQTSFFLDTDRSGSIGYFSGQSPDEITAARRLDSFFGHENNSATDDPLATSMRRLIMGSLYQGAVNLVNCSLSQIHVEAIVNCTKSQCGVQKIRRSQTDTRPTNFTGLEHFDIVTGFLKNLPIAFNTGAGSTPTERFLFNTNSTPTHQTTGLLNDALLSVLFVNLTQVPIETFSHRLSVILNTYYQLSVAPTGYSGDLPQNLSLYGPDTLPSTTGGLYSSTPSVRTLLEYHLSAPQRMALSCITKRSSSVILVGYPYSLLPLVLYSLQGWLVSYLSEKP